MWHDKKNAQWQLRFKTNADIGDKAGSSSLSLTEYGDVKKIRFASKESTVGQKTHYWITSLHMGHISHEMGSVLYRAFLILVGLSVAIMSVTGGYLWWRGWRRRTRRTHKKRDKRIKHTVNKK